MEHLTIRSVYLPDEDLVSYVQTMKLENNEAPRRSADNGFQLERGKCGKRYRRKCALENFFDLEKDGILHIDLVKRNTAHIFG